MVSRVASALPGLQTAMPKSTSVIAIVAVAVAPPDDVRRLEIAVHDARRVRLGERGARSRARCAARARGQRTVGEDLVERLALDELHREVRPAVGELADRVDRDDAGMRARAPRCEPRARTAAPSPDRRRSRGSAPSSRPCARGRPGVPRYTVPNAPPPMIALDLELAVDRAPSSASPTSSPRRRWPDPRPAAVSSPRMRHPPPLHERRAAVGAEPPRLVGRRRACRTEPHDV